MWPRIKRVLLTSIGGVGLIFTAAGILTAFFSPQVMTVWLWCSLLLVFAVSFFFLHAAARGQEKSVSDGVLRMPNVMKDRWIESSELWNCEHAFDYQCPQQFEDLGTTKKADVRFCTVCQESVYRVSSPQQFVEHARAGHCIAIPSKHGPGTLRLMELGRPSRAEAEKFARLKSDVRDWWLELLEADPDVDDEALEMVRQVLRETGSLITVLDRNTGHEI